MSKNDTVLYLKNTQVLQKIHRNIKFGRCTSLNFNSQVCVLQIGAEFVMHVENPNRFIKQDRNRLSGWSGPAGWGTLQFTYQIRIYWLFKGCSTSLDMGEWLVPMGEKQDGFTKPKNSKQRLIFFFLQHNIHHSKMFNTCRFGGWKDSTQREGEEGYWPESEHLS